MQKFLDKIISFSYLALVIITPFLFTTQTTELYEIPKMLFVYFFAAIIFFSTLIKFIENKKILIPTLWPLAIFTLFVALQIISTLTSVDKFTSVFGYPTRLNGGLLSQFAYLAIFFGALVNLGRVHSHKLIAASVISAFVVSLWGIPGHFDKDPSCLVLTGKLTSGCWQQEFNPKIRIFSTLGQPNWLAQYLVLVLPFALIFTFLEKRPRLKIFWAIVALTLITALIFTNSRSGFLGFILEIALLTILLGTKFLKQKRKILLPLAFVITFLIVTLGASLFGRIKESVNCQLSTVNCPNGATDSASIRLIVWQGALSAFAHRPLLGFGPETFAYAYYLYRPLAHNQTSEWNFFYNKAHNEFLNYLVNVGILGLTSYLVFLLVSLKSLLKVAKSKEGLIAKAAISAITIYQIVIFFGFSTVVSQLLMYLLIPLVIVGGKNLNFYEINLDFLGNFVKRIAIISVSVFGLWALLFIIRIFLADVSYTSAQKTDGARSLLSYSSTINLSPAKNPNYFANYAYANALYINGADEQFSQVLEQQASSAAATAAGLSPNNVLITRKVANTYLLLSSIDKKYQKDALTAAQKLPRLAPTDPQSYLSLAKVESAVGEKQKAQESLNYALKLKPDYLEAQQLLEQIESKDLQ